MIRVKLQVASRKFQVAGHRIQAAFQSIPVLKKRLLLGMFALGLALLGALLASSSTVVSPMVCDARPASACPTQCQTVHHDGYNEWHPGYNEYHPGYWEHHPAECHEEDWGMDCRDAWDEWHDGWDEYHDGYWEWHAGWDEQQCEEKCDDQKVRCDGTCPNGGTLYCRGGCGRDSNCWCEGGNDEKECVVAANCNGPVQCPHSQQAGAYWTCQANRCVSVCGNDPNPNDPGNPPSSRTPPPTTGPGTPTATPVLGTPTRTVFATPRPVEPFNCPSNPEALGGSVKQIIPPSQPDVQMAFQPNYPTIVGQDPTQRGTDADVQLTLQACTVIWHYRVNEEYTFCGKEKCNCSVDDCSIRTRIKEWDETCQEPYALSQVTIDSTLNPLSVARIHGELADRYPGIKVYQGTLRLFPSALARVANYTVGSPTTWEMRGAKYPHQDPGFWDLNVNVTTDKTAHCAPLTWAQNFPNAFRAYLREERLK